VISLLVPASTAFAQRAPSKGRGFIVVNGGYQATSNDFGADVTFQANAEEGSFTTDYEVNGGPAFDIAGGAMLWRRFAVGVGVTRFYRSTPATLTGSVPHPLVFDRDRPVTGSVGGLKREELAIHVQARAIAPIGTRLQVAVFGGPSFFQVKQGMATAITWSESYPFDEATFASATTATGEGSKVGFHAGADVAYFFSRTVGIGGAIQFSGTTVDIEVGGNTHRAKAGGLNAGGGLRLRF
jgi:hypothetical protein